MLSTHNKEDRIMIDSKDILTLLSIPCEDISNVEIISDTSEITFIDIELKDNRSSCPFCFQNNIAIKDYYNVKIKNSIIRKNKLYVTIRMRRYKCKYCNKTFKQEFKFYEDKNSISLTVKRIVQNMLMDRISMEYIAKELDISKQTVINILDELPEPKRLILPNVICLDEFHFSNANHKAGKYPCVISNPFNTELIDIIESRRKDYLIDYFQNISFKERSNVKYFISDMNETYRSIYKIFFKDAVHIVDHFHIVKLFTEAIQKIRIKIMKSYPSNSKEYKYLKKNWKLFLMKRFDLKDNKFVNHRTGVVHYTLDSIDMVLKAFPDLYDVYWAKEEFSSSMLKLHNYDDTKKRIDFFINKFSKSLNKELNNIGITFKNWYKEIINSYSKNTYGVVLTNAMAESNNNYIQTLINIGYGYTNFNRLRKRILYMSSNKNRNQY